jgi:hypothetical protein
MMDIEMTIPAESAEAAERVLPCEFGESCGECRGR